jgi:hypothetical protein
MRPSKSRTRNKNNNNANRNRSGVSVINRVYDSSGPEGKVRGTPQQIIDKYTQLARDAQLSNDRVAAENYQQHGEHYIRLLATAQREIDVRREQQEREHRERQQSRTDQPTGGNNPSHDQRNEPRNDQRNEPRTDHRNDHQNDRRNDQQRDANIDQGSDARADQHRPQPDEAASGVNQSPDPSMSEQPDIYSAPIEAQDSGLVETPEAPKAKRKPRPRKPKAEPVEAGQSDTPEAAE